MHVVVILKITFSCILLRELLLALALNCLYFATNLMNTSSGHTHVAEALKIPLHIFFTMPWT